MRLALLSNVTVDLLAGMVKKNHEVYLSAGFDTWQQEMIVPTSGLYEFKPEAVIVLLHAGAYEWKDIESGRKLIDEWCDALSALTTNLPAVPVFVSSLDITVPVHYGAEVRIEGALENYLIERVQGLHKSIYILPVKDLITDLGRNNFYSSKMWYVGSMPYSMKGLAALNDLKKMKSLHGLTRSLLANMVTGVTEGYEKKLEVNGVGYRAAKQGKKLTLNLGYSHPVEMEDPEGIETVVDGNSITVKGIDKEKVGQFAAEIRDKRRPEPYKGKGIKYTTETIRRKVGKTGKK